MIRKLEYHIELYDYNKHPVPISHNSGGCCSCKLILPTNHDELIRLIPQEFFRSFDETVSDIYRAVSGIQKFPHIKLRYEAGYGLISAGWGADGIMADRNRMFIVII